MKKEDRLRVVKVLEGLKQGCENGIKGFSYKVIHPNMTLKEAADEMKIQVRYKEALQYAIKVLKEIEGLKETPKQPDFSVLVPTQGHKSIPYQQLQQENEKLKQRHTLDNSQIKVLQQENKQLKENYLLMSQKVIELKKLLHHLV